MSRPRGTRSQRFDILNERIKKCRDCPGLNRPTSTPSAPGYGNVKSPIMFVGQSLHAYNPETPTQIPFLGPVDTYDSGSLLIEAIEGACCDHDSIMWKFKDVFTTNAVHCHPPKNRASTAKEMYNCRHFLEDEIRIVKPRIILALGRSAKMQLGFMGMYIPSERYELAWKFYGMTKKRMGCVWVYHPSYLLRRGRDKEEIAEWKKSIENILKMAFRQ